VRGGRDVPGGRRRTGSTVQLHAGRGAPTRPAGGDHSPDPRHDRDRRAGADREPHPYTVGDPDPSAQRAEGAHGRTGIGRPDHRADIVTDAIAAAHGDAESDTDAERRRGVMITPQTDMRVRAEYPTRQ
jgi:hypothetical protein